MSKVSIIVPVYNVEIYLEKCLNSIINQTLHDIEIICINDGSTDNSLNILKKYAEIDNRIIIINQENKGVSVARNMGLQKATSPYIMFVDPDDWLELNACEVMYNAITSNDCDLVQAKFNIHYDVLHQLKEADEWHFNSKHIGMYFIQPKHLNFFDHSAGGKLLKKETIDKYKINFPEGLYYEDLSFIYKYFTVSRKILIIENKLYNYLRRPNSTMSNTYKNSIMPLDHIKVCIDFYDYLQTWNLFNKYEEIFWIIFEDYFWVTLSFLNKEKKSLAFDLAHSFIVDKNLEHLKHKLNNSTFKTLFNLKNKKYNKIYTINPSSLHKKFTKLFFYLKYNRYSKYIKILGFPVYTKQHDITTIKITILQIKKTPQNIVYSLNMNIRLFKFKRK